MARSLTTGPSPTAPRPPARRVRGRQPRYRTGGGRPPPPGPPLPRLGPGESAGGGPGPDRGGDAARRGPLPCGEPLERLSPAPTRVRARPVVRGRQPTVPRAPLTHRCDNTFARPPPLDRAWVAGLAVGVRVAVAVPRLGVRAAAAAHADVAGLDRPGLLPGRVVEVRLDRRRREPE